jgi:hypothetical protein
MKEMAGVLLYQPTIFTCDVVLPPIPAETDRISETHLALA